MGLARRTPEDRWTRFTVESTGGGLRSLDMTALLVEPDGTLWMATALGLSRRTPEADWSYYDLAGIKHLALDAQGTLWLGSDSGLYRLLPDALITIEE
jgi:ligand-binding sensor domain-containing protein